MNGKELLELAAKAAGYSVSSDGEGGLTISVRRGVCRGWDPLTDDGDALRLAVKLSMSLEKVVSSRGSAWIADRRAEEIVGTDSLAAARRAIVRVAAKIGAQIP